jgi:hypothetical protein
MTRLGLQRDARLDFSEFNQRRAWHGWYLGGAAWDEMRRA